MSDHALAVLEFERVLERVAERASSEPGRRRIQQLRPRSTLADVARELDRVRATMRFVEERPEWGMPPVPDVEDSLRRLGVSGAVLEAAELFALGVLLSSSRVLARALERVAGDRPELTGVREALIELEDLEKEISRAVDAEDNVLDTASKELRRVRDRLRGAHGRVVKRLEAYLGRMAERFVVPDASVTLREGRYVIPVRREGRREVGGIVHDESQTGATLYVEPPEAIEAMNELRDLEREEVREVRRILASLTDRLAPVHDELRGALSALADFDALHARARVAAAWRAHVPELMDDPKDGIRLVGARHPLLVETEGLEKVIPFDLDLGPGERAVVVSGPNTGGKSVFLKATGLIAALAQSGVVPPVGPGTRLPVFASFYADIGDEQSIAQSLSTFSAHLANLSEIVGRADTRSLVLVDEMGTGTDPAEGAALARSVLEELVARGALTLASSHLGALKRLDGEGTGIVNASLQFDAERMEPTYRLLKGRPGRSYGLAIARRLGFPAEVLDRADGYRDEDEANLEETLTRLEQREREAERLVHELDLERKRTARLSKELEAREQTLSDAEAAHTAQARDDARKLLLDARAEVEDAVQELKRAAEEGEDLDEAVHRARRRVEHAAAEQGRAGEGGRPTGRSPRAPAGLGTGDRVRLRATGAKGRVTEIRAGRAVVEAGAIKLEVALHDLERIEGGGKPSPEATRSGSWSGPDRGAARVEVDLRGLRVHELEVALSRALDEAILEDLPELRIIHGKGTGALRQRVGEMLESDGRVRSVRMGGPTEGGAGVTVAGFREAS
ncbi:MAG: endonuclease MutS2 [Gemmatimonadota bacterium]